jgi:hypothetical protein
MASAAVRASLSVTPGLKPTSTIQSKPSAIGAVEMPLATGSCRTPWARTRFTSPSLRPETV